MDSDSEGRRGREGRGWDEGGACGGQEGDERGRGEGHWSPGSCSDAGGLGAEGGRDGACPWGLGGFICLSTLDMASPTWHSGMAWHGMRWHGMAWDKMGWDGIRWDEMAPRPSTNPAITGLFGPFACRIAASRPSPLVLPAQHRTRQRPAMGQHPLPRALGISGAVAAETAVAVAVAVAVGVVEETAVGVAVGMETAGAARTAALDGPHLWPA
jgi:hypothetical protein